MLCEVLWNLSGQFLSYGPFYAIFFGSTGILISLHLPSNHGVDVDTIISCCNINDAIFVFSAVCIHSRNSGISMSLKVGMAWAMG